MTYSIQNTGSVPTACPVSAGAQPVMVFDGGEPNGATGYVSAYGSDYGDWIAATKFVISSPSAINLINWWGFYAEDGGSSGFSDYILYIYDGSGTTPGAEIVACDLGTAEPVDTGDSMPGWGLDNHRYAYSGKISNLTLQPGAYFVGLRTSPRYSASSRWFWQTTSGGSQLGGAGYHPADGWKSDAKANLAFKLSYVSAPSLPAPESLRIQSSNL